MRLKQLFSECSSLYSSNVSPLRNLQMIGHYLLRILQAKPSFTFYVSLKTFTVFPLVSNCMYNQIQRVIEDTLKVLYTVFVLSMKNRCRLETSFEELCQAVFSGWKKQNMVVERKSGYFIMRLLFFIEFGFVKLNNAEILLFCYTGNAKLRIPLQNLCCVKLICSLPYYLEYPAAWWHSCRLWPLFK